MQGGVTTKIPHSAPDLTPGAGDTRPRDEMSLAQSMVYADAHPTGGAIRVQPRLPQPSTSTDKKLPC